MKTKIIIPRDNPISNFDIIDICRKLGILLKGTFMKDELTSLDIGNYIINLQDSDQSGSHWCAMCIRKDCVVWVDSFGAVCPQNIYELIKKYFKHFYCNNWIIQDLKSEACGWYCICYFLYLKKHENNGKSLQDNSNDYINNYFDQTDKNFGVLKKLFNQLQR